MRVRRTTLCVRQTSKLAAAAPYTAAAAAAVISRLLSHSDPLLSLSGRRRHEKKRKGDGDGDDVRARGVCVYIPLSHSALRCTCVSPRCACTRASSRTLRTRRGARTTSLKLLARTHAPVRTITSLSLSLPSRRLAHYCVSLSPSPRIYLYERACAAAAFSRLLARSRSLYCTRV